MHARSGGFFHHLTGRYRPNKAGAVTLEDFIGTKHSKDWGMTQYTRSLRDILGAEEARKWINHVARQRHEPGMPSQPPGQPSFSHLALELQQQLTGDALRIWSDATVREQGLRDIMNAIPASGPVYPNNPSLKTAIDRVDAAMGEGLQALGLPRGPVQEVRVQDIPERGTKEATCEINISAYYIRDMIQVHGRPDTVVRTWVHESLHARQPFDPAWGAEYAAYNGYEEGLVEALARLITRAKAGMNPIEDTNLFYVRAYQGLARVLGVSEEELLRMFWNHPVGQVRARFVDVVDSLWYNHLGRSLTPQERSTLWDMADTMFFWSNGTSAFNASHTDQAIKQAWRSALP